jgi:hypothetical protein
MNLKKDSSEDYKVAGQNTFPTAVKAGLKN